MLSYKPMYKTMKNKKITTYALIQRGINPRTLQNIKEGKGITTYTLEKICMILSCQPNDVIEFIEDE